MFSGDSIGPIDLRLLHVLDGGMGTALEEQGYDTKSSPARSAGANITHPELVVKTHLSFIEAGSDVILTNTHQANIKRLTEKLGADEALNYVRAGVELANKAVEESKKRVYVVGSIGPFSTSLSSKSSSSSLIEWKDGKFDNELIRQNYETQAKALHDCGIRIFVFETIPSLIEAVYAKEVLESLECDGWVSVVCKDGEHLRSGDDFIDVVKELSDSKYVKAIGINCTSPDDIKSLLKLGTPFLKRRGYIVYPNSGEKYDDESKEFYGNVRIAKIVEELEDWIRIGVRIIGGCCRVNPEDIKRIANELNKLN